MLRPYSPPCTRRSSPQAFCPGCYANLRGRSSFQGHRWYHTPRPAPKFYWRDLMDLPPDIGPVDKNVWACVDSQFLTDYPSLARGMCDCWWSNGKKRTPWTLKLAFSPTAASLILVDTERKRFAVTTSSGLLEALLELEIALAAGTLSWRASKY